MALLNTAKKVYTGATAATKVYLGDTMVWPPPIPAGPTAVRSEWTSATVNTVKWTDSVEAGVTYEVYVSPTLLDDMTQGTRIATGIGAGVGTYTHTKSAPEQLESILYYGVFTKKGVGFSYPELASTPRVRGSNTWLPITIAPKSDKVQVLYHTLPGESKNVSFVMTGGASTVDWGDGTAPTNHANGSTASHDYVYSAMPAAGEIAAGRQAMATVSPQDGSTLTGFVLSGPAVPTNKTPDTAYLIGKGAADVTVSVQTDPTWNGYPGTGSMPVAWFKFVPAATGAYTIYDGGADDSYGYLFDTTPVGPNYTNYYLSNDDSGPGSGFQFSSVTLTAGTTYWLAASFYDYGRPPTNGKLDVTILGGALTGGVAPGFPVEVSVASETVGTLGVNQTGMTRLNLISKFTADTGDSLFEDHTYLVSICGEVGSKSTSMRQMFSYDAALSMFPKVDASNITDMYGMFQNCSAITTAEVPALDTGNGTNFSYMFEDCSNVGFTTGPPLNTSNGLDFSGMFSDCANLTSIPLYDTAKGIDFNYMFYYCPSLSSAGVPALNTGNGTNFGGMFYECSSAAFTSPPWMDTSKGTNFESMFYGASKVSAVPAYDLSKGLDFSWMFRYNNSLNSATIPVFNTSSGTNFDGMFNTGGPPAFTSVTVDTSQAVTCYSMFYGCTALASVTLTGGIANNTDFTSMFSGCTAMTTAGLPSALTSGFGTVSGQWFTNMFYGCNNAGFTTIPLMNTANGLYFSAMFYGCNKLTSVPALNTGNGIDFSNMFRGCTVLATMPITSVSNGTAFNNMFQGCAALTTANIPAALTTGVGTGNGVIFYNMFDSCNNAGFTSVPLMDTSKGTNFSAMFYGCNKLTSVPALNTGAGTGFGSMFQGCTVLATAPITSVSNGTAFNNMFYGCAALTSANIPAALTTGGGTGNGTNFSSMFYGCNNVGFTSVPLINTAKGTNFSGMFNGCNKVSNFPALNTGLGTDFSNMFQSCTVLTTAPITSVVNGTNFSYMLYNCTSLTSANIPAALTTGGGTANGTNFSLMFALCSNAGFTSVPLINTAKGTNFLSMFNGCSKLTTIPAINCSLGTNFGTMFSTCTLCTSVLATGFRYAVNISTCAASMPTANINTFYTNLGTAAGAQTVTVTALTNQAASTKSIATAKGWTVA